MDLLDGDNGAEPVVTDSERGERLNEAGEAVKRRRGRPPGSKNKPKADERNALIQRLAGVVALLFFVLGFVAKMFGYEYKEKLDTDELKEGAEHLVPIADKLGVILTIATYIGFPLWVIAKVADKFAKKESRTGKQPMTAVPGNPPDSLADGATPTPSVSPSGVIPVSEARPL